MYTYSTYIYIHIHTDAWPLTPLASHRLERYLSCGALQSLSSDVSSSGGGWEGLELSFTTLGQHDVEDACFNGKNPPTTAS